MELRGRSFAFPLLGLVLAVGDHMQYGQQAMNSFEFMREYDSVVEVLFEFYENVAQRSLYIREESSSPWQVRVREIVILVVIWYCV